MIMLAIASLALTLALLPFFALLALVTASALLGPARTGAVEAGRGTRRFLFVIPAHDEERSIAGTVASCRSVAYDRGLFGVLVVADNCGDATAEAARRAGAEVAERRDPERRGKGYALQYAFEGPWLGGYDAAVVVDADSVVDPGILAAFAGGLDRGDDWLQAENTASNPDATWRTRLMTHALSLCNGVWMLGMDRLGPGGGLKGNGMCLSTRGLRRVPWRAYGLAEDREFSWQLREAGERVRFVRGARVLSEMVTRGGAGAASQRRRWEAGRRALVRGRMGRILRSRDLGPGRKILFLIDLMFPTLVTLALGLACAAGVHAAAPADPRVSAVSAVLLPVHGLMLGVLALYAVSPCLVLGLPVRYLSGLLMLPYYAAWKLAAAAGGAPASWVRTRREAEREGAGERVSAAEPAAADDSGAAGVGVVVIGRNEGERLRRCLGSVVGRGRAVVYVDSGSTDGSPGLARSMGAEVVELDPGRPFTAARARNEGFERVRRLAPGLKYVQFVDGDCEVVGGWLVRACRELDARPGAAVVCGRRRERYPERSVYNRLGDMEWDTPVGEAGSCGGDAVMRASALAAAGGFNPEMIAGEEPELCWRLRRAGWSVVRVDAEMTRHDLAMSRFGECWRRQVRGGYASLELARRHPGGPFARQVLSARVWTAGWLLAAAGSGAVAAWSADPRVTALAALVASAPAAQAVRVALLARRRSPDAGTALAYGVVTVLGKWAEASGQLRYLLDRNAGRRATLIEYKGLTARRQTRPGPVTNP